MVLEDAEEREGRGVEGRPGREDEEGDGQLWVWVCYGVNERPADDSFQGDVHTRARMGAGVDVDVLALVRKMMASQERSCAAHMERDGEAASP